MAPAHEFRSRVLIAAAVLLTLGVTGSMWRLDAREDAPPQREFTLNARRYAFNPAHLEVTQDDIVKITLHAEDIAHSFTIDSYRIAKRAGAGQTVTFEFRADQVGRFPFYCNLTNDERCREMRGELVVRPR